MLQREVCQVDDTVIIENIIRMSREHGIRINVEFNLHDNERSLNGILKDIVNVHSVPMLYLGRVMTGKDSVETHALIPVSRIEAITFETQNGFLDNLIPEVG